MATKNVRTVSATSEVSGGGMVNLRIIDAPVIAEKARQVRIGNIKSYGLALIAGGAIIVAGVLAINHIHKDAQRKIDQANQSIARTLRTK